MHRRCGTNSPREKGNETDAEKSLAGATSAACATLSVLSGNRGGRRAQQVQDVPGSPDATTTIDGRQLPPPDPKFGGVIKGNALQSKAWWPPRDRAAQGRAQRAADHDRRRGLRRAEHLRRRHSDAGAGPHRQSGPALHAVPFHRALLADARGADHRPQPSLGRLRRGLGTVHGFPGLQQHHPEGQGDHRPNPARTTASPLRGSARTTTRRPSTPARSGRSTSGPSAWASSISTASSAATPASGSRTCSATRRPSIPTSANPGWNLTTARPTTPSTG